jgi:TRAP-type C4-dicarboxylate transport system substrate-binding protein
MFDKRSIACIVTIFLVLGLALPAMSSSTQSITLKMVTFTPTGSPIVTPAFWLRDRVKDRTDGKLVINIIGGPEAIPGDNQPAAVRNGVVDMVLSPPDESLIPESMSFILSTQTPAQEREGGYYDLMAEIYRKQNLLYLGRGSLGNEFHIMLAKKRAQRPEDLAGLKLRASGTTLPLIKALEAAPVSVPLPDVYTAMERGVVDGTIGVKSGLKTWGLAPVVKYTINHPLYGQNLLILVNMDSWNKLPADYQNVMKEIMVDIENNDLAEYYEERSRIAFEMGFENGMQLIDFSAADAKRLVDLAQKVIWDEIYKKSPEYAPKLQQSLMK